MVLHITARLAWHDRNWDGRICDKPSENVYCSGNFSLLSTRIQRRKNALLEDKYAGRTIDEILEKEGYIPPCYWIVNLLGDKELKVKHVHPFCDFSPKAKMGGIEPIDDDIKPHAILSWNFKFSFVHDGLFKYPRDLVDRLEHYLSYIIPGKSVIIFYLNYSNPVNGDAYKYLIVGAALVKEVKKPKQYKFDPDYNAELNKKYGYFPEIDWSFQIILDPETIVIVPYQEYIKMIEEAESEEGKRKIEKMLSEIVVEADKRSIFSHFKYVSSHISSDKALYLLYKILTSLKKAENHGIVGKDLIERYIRRAERLIKHLWELRGEIPSFKKVFMVLGEVSGNYSLRFSSSKVTTDYKKYKEVEKMLDTLVDLYGNRIIEIIRNFDAKEIDAFLNDLRQDYRVDNRVKSLMDQIIKLIKGRGQKYFKLIELLCRLDLTYVQIRNIIQAIEDKKLDIKNVLDYPYVLVYKYVPQLSLWEEEWFLEFMDFDIDTFLLDMPLIPDPEYVNYEPLSSPKSPDRLIASIYEVLYHKAVVEGITALTEEELINTINEAQVLTLYHGAQPKIFKNDIDNTLVSHKDMLSDVIYQTEDLNEGRIFQLRYVREIERTIEEAIKKVLDKNPLLKPDTNVSEHVEHLMGMVSSRLSEARIPENQREEFLKMQRDIYENSIKRALLIITGGAGTGKTETIINLVELFTRIGKKPIFIVTPTGKSSLVVEERLRERNLLPSNTVFVSTIHRLLYSYYFERYATYSRKLNFQELIDLIDKTLDDMRFFIEFKKYIRVNSGIRIQPKILIIDEASMVDEVLLAVLLSIVNIDSLEHLIFVGDSNQLPPIGLGKPFVDIIDFLREREENHIKVLETPIRFSTETGIWAFSQTFVSADYPIDSPDNYIDDTLKIEYFTNRNDLEQKLKNILKELLGRKVNIEEDMLILLNDIMEVDSSKERPSLKKIDKIQILAPTRYGEMGTEYINKVIILNGKNIADYEYVKILNEQNRYVTLNIGKTLLVPNGSLGCWTNKENGRVYFKEVDELIKQLNESKKSEIYGREYWEDLRTIISKLKELVYEITGYFKEGDNYISPGYAITVHKAQGSDFNYTIFILPRITSYVTKELIYTALTRARDRLYLLMHINLKNNIIPILHQIKLLSELDKRHTLLFKYRRSSGKVYGLRLRDGKMIYLRSKVEYMIARVLDDLGVEFEYEPRDLIGYGVLPDFRITVDGRVYFIEHLGLLDNEVYRRRWEIKKKIYEDHGLLNQIITTSESKEGTLDLENTIRKIINDIKKGSLRDIETGYPSKHHYFL